MKKYVMALGTFDGVHLGHKSLVAAADALATQLNISAAVFTFSDYPREYLTGQRIGQITTLAEKQRLLHQAGAQEVFCRPFRELCDMSPEQFITFLVDELGAAGFVCGEDYRFGKRGSGDAATLTALAERRGMKTVVLPFVCDGEGNKIASCRIRQWLADGEMEKARATLGHYFSVEGEVRHGKGLAHQWGTPTVNIPIPEQLVRIRYGVYHTKVYVEGQVYDGITNVGLRPTFDDGDTPNIETYILEGRFDHIDRVRVEFLRFLREERKFEDERSLQQQIEQDIKALRKEVE